MTEVEENTRIRMCPSCGTPVKPKFQVNEKVKMTLALLLVGYVLICVMIFLAGTPVEMRKGCGSFDYRIHLPFFTPNPERCRETETSLWFESMLNLPGIQLFIGGGLLAGLLIFYYDWFEEMYRKWKAKRTAENPDNEIRYKNKCQNCGRQWN